MRYTTTGGIPASVETMPNPHAADPACVALVHRTDDTPAPRFLVFYGDTEQEAAATAATWLRATLIQEATR